MEAVTQPERKPLLLLISGPAGCGKTTLCDSLIEACPAQLARVVTSTTRPSREGEIHEQDYYFFDRETFTAKLEAGDFYEHAEIHGNLYGTLRSEVMTKLQASRDILLNIDVQGAAAFRAAAQEDAEIAKRLVSIFILPPSMDVLRERMQARGKDSPEVIERRLATAREEIPQWHHYHYAITSSTREADFTALSAIYHAEKLKVRQ